MNTKLFTLILVTVLLGLSACTPQAGPAATTEPVPGLPNPASVNCEEKGGKVEIRKADDGSEQGFCIFPDGSECDEWAYYRGECKPESEPATDSDTAPGLPNPASVYCEEQGGKLEIRKAEDGSEAGFCLFPDGSECDEWAFFRRECKPASTPDDVIPPAPNTSDVPDEQNKVANVAKEMLAGQLGIATEDILLAGMEEVQWPDGCLGLPEKGTACITVIVPGYRIHLSVGDQRYIFRSDKTGSNVRQEPEVAGVAKEILAEQLGIAPEEIQLFGAVMQDWPNGCLGLAKPDEVCTEAIVPGYQLVLEAKDARYIFRTDLTGENIRQETSTDQ